MLRQTDSFLRERNNLMFYDVNISAWEDRWFQRGVEGSTTVFEQDVTYLPPTMLYWVHRHIHMHTAKIIYLYAAQTVLTNGSQCVLDLITQYEC